MPVSCHFGFLVVIGLAVFRKLGISASQATALFYRQVQLRQGIPFPVELPNAETVKAIKKARDGEGTSFDSPDALFEDLGIC